MSDTTATKPRTAFEVLADPKTKYYTAFLFEGKSPSELHCTHKYLGQLDSNALTSIIKLCNAYFAVLKSEAIEVPVINFNTEDHFGADYKTRVLRPKVKAAPALLTDLRKVLNVYAKDSFKGYRPHVTHASLKEINEPFYSYALVGSGGIVVKEWKL